MAVQDLHSDILCWQQDVEQVTWQSNSTRGQATDGQKKKRFLPVKQTRNGEGSARAGLREDLWYTGAGQMSQEMCLC